MNQNGKNVKYEDCLQMGRVDMEQGFFLNACEIKNAVL